MSSDSDDCIYTTPPTSPLIHELEPDDSPDMVAWKMDIVDDHVAKLSALLKNDELDIIRIEALKSTKTKRWRMKMQEKRKRQLQQRKDDSNLGVRTVPTIGKKDQPALRHPSRPINTISAPGYGLSDDSDMSDSDSPAAPAKNTANVSSAAPTFGTQRTPQTTTNNAPHASPFILAPVSSQPLTFDPILANNIHMPTALKSDLLQKQSTQALGLYSQVVQHQEDVYRLSHPSHTRNTPPNLYSGPPPTAPRGHFQNQLPAPAPPVTYGEYPQSYQYHQYQSTPYSHSPVPNRTSSAIIIEK
ncbi:hypothetical protein [Absidia glauca]|uniref:Uncharacterized protein n=1 Tax=Absidia glauca TaxID=4829 RepID=A0A163K3F3_ABSGL|nr:hypothetical protein [Absidia glauca]